MPHEMSCSKLLERENVLLFFTSEMIFPKSGKYIAEDSSVARK